MTRARAQFTESRLGKTKICKFECFRKISMAKFDGIIGKALLAVTEKENELTLVFADNRYLFVTLEGGRIKAESVPE